MNAHASDILPATPTDLAADMGYHRQTYRRFLKLMKWAIAGSALILLVVFFILY